MEAVVIYMPFVSDLMYAQTFEWGRGRPDVVPWPILLHDYTAYCKMLSAVWMEQEDTVIVEHDMLPADGVIEEMVSCEHLWCASPYRASPNKNEPDLIYGLGCTKFSASLKAEESDLMRVVSEIKAPGLPAKDWRRMDVHISGQLRRRSYEPHVHRRSTHLHYEKVSDA